MVEGIVPLDYADKSMRGLAVFVEAPLIHAFLQEIEQGKGLTEFVIEPPDAAS